MRFAWLSRTARRWELKSRPSRGTLPWIAATVAVPSSAESSTSGRAARAAATGTRTAAAVAAAARRGSSPVLRWIRKRRTASKRPKPHRTTAKERSGVPPSAASGRNTLSACPKAILPQGKPPNGTPARSASSSVQTAAAQSGQQASRDTAEMPMQPTAMNSASAAASASHGTGPTSSPVQCSRGSMKPSPASRPRPNAARSLRSNSTQPSRANPGRTSHHSGRGGKLAYSITPDRTAAAGRARSGSRRPARGRRRASAGRRPGRWWCSPGGVYGGGPGTGSPVLVTESLPPDRFSASSAHMTAVAVNVCASPRRPGRIRPSRTGRSQAGGRT